MVIIKDKHCYKKMLMLLNMLMPSIKYDKIPRLSVTVRLLSENIGYILPYMDICTHIIW